VIDEHGEDAQDSAGGFGPRVFDNVQVAPAVPESESSHQNMAVRVTESRRFNLRYGLGYDTKEKVRGILELSDLNISAAPSGRTCASVPA